MDYTLLVMAAGMGSRFGSLKQVEPVGPNGEFIIDYSVYDAIKAGFNHIIFVIRRETEELFRETIGKRLEGKVKVSYVYQELSDLPEGYSISDLRSKPLGTGHAIYAARNLLTSSFAVINADDFYGPEAYEILMDFFKNNEDRTHYLAVCYKVINTLSLNGSVKRGVARVSNGILEGICESALSETLDGVIAQPLDGSDSFKVSDDDLVTVNLFGFTPNFLKAVVNDFPKFLDRNLNDLDSEYLMPDIITSQISCGSAKVYVKETGSKWYGVTYKEDKAVLVNAINNYIIQGVYPACLWEGESR